MFLTGRIRMILAQLLGYHASAPGGDEKLSPWVSLGLLRGAFVALALAGAADATAAQPPSGRAYNDSKARAYNDSKARSGDSSYNAA